MEQSSEDSRVDSASEAQDWIVRHTSACLVRLREMFVPEFPLPQAEATAIGRKWEEVEVAGSVPLT
jgi:hypothetical protein